MDIYKDKGVKTGLNQSFGELNHSGKVLIHCQTRFEKEEIGDDYKSVDAKSFRHSLYNQ